jgi:hypothetical protein
MSYLKLGNKHIGFTQFYIIDCVSKTAITKTHIFQGSYAQSKHIFRIDSSP